MQHDDLEDFVSGLAYRLGERYAEEPILAVELYSAVQGLFTSLRWTVLRRAKQIAKDGELTECVSNIETTDHFASEWMSRREIVDRIMLTSGFNEEMSDYTLSAMEDIVDSALRDMPSVRIAGIGDIHSPEYPRYYIDLVTALSVGGGSAQSMIVGH
jgi:hypothetical protein